MRNERIIALFKQRDYLVERLASTDRKIADAGRQWSDEHGYRVTLRPEQLRRKVSAG